MKLGIDAAKKAGGVCEAVVCYSGDVADQNRTKYTLDYYLNFVDQLVAEGIHVLGIKDMAGLMKPMAATLCVLFFHCCALSNLVKSHWLHPQEVSRPTDSRPLS